MWKKIGKWETKKIVDFGESIFPGPPVKIRGQWDLCWPHYLRRRLWVAENTAARSSHAAETASLICQFRDYVSSLNPLPAALRHSPLPTIVIPLWRCAGCILGLLLPLGAAGSRSFALLGFCGTRSSRKNLLFKDQEKVPAQGHLVKFDAFYVKTILVLDPGILNIGTHLPLTQST